MSRLTSRTAALAAALLMGSGLAVTSVAGSAQAVEPGADPFYTFAGTPAQLAAYAPGAVIASRPVTASLAGLPTGASATQLLYRSIDQQGRPVANVTSVIKPPVANPFGAQLISYQSFYDSLNPADSPSRGIAGALPSAGGAIVTAETAMFAPLLTAGYTVNFPDTEGQSADFAAGPEYGVLTLDSIRAASDPSVLAQTGLTATTKVGMFGYSGGAIATGWAAALAPTYAPDVNARLVGATEGGVLVAPARNLKYIDGTPMWGGVEGMALVGVARSFGIDFTPYLSDFGKEQFAKLQNASIGAVLSQYPDFRFARLVKPEYADPASIEPYVTAANKLNLGSAPAPTIPMQIRQGNAGETEQTPGDKPGIGPGDGVMIAGDVRALARQYCAAGTPVDYAEYSLSHTPGAAPWLAGAVPFLAARFAGTPMPTNNCASIAAGNSLAPEVFRPSTTAPTTGPAAGNGAKPTGPSSTRTRVRLPRVWQVKGKEATRLSVAVVTKGVTSNGARAGRVVVRVDGRKVRKLSVPVALKSGKQVSGKRVRLPSTLAYGAHKIRVRFKPTDKAAYTGSASRRITLTVVRNRPRAG